MAARHARRGCNGGNWSTKSRTRLLTSLRSSARSLGSSWSRKSPAPVPSASRRSMAASTSSRGEGRSLRLRESSMALWATVPRTDGIVQAKPRADSATWWASQVSTWWSGLFPTHRGFALRVAPGSGSRSVQGFRPASRWWRSSERSSAGNDGRRSSPRSVARVSAWAGVSAASTEPRVEPAVVPPRHALRQWERPLCTSPPPPGSWLPSPSPRPRGPWVPQPTRRGGPRPFTPSSGGGAGHGLGPPRRPTRVGRVADMVEGVVVANDLVGAAADRCRAALWQVVEPQVVTSAA